MDINKKFKSNDIYFIDPRAIVVVKDFNSRTDFGDIDELAKQIKEQGILNPISVVPYTDDNGSEKYRLIDGERRYRAVMSLIEKGEDINTVKAILLSKHLTEEDFLIQQALRNEGKRFSEYEYGLLCYKLKERCGKNLTQIAQCLGKTVAQISQYMSHLNRDTDIQNLMRNNVIKGSNVREIYKAHENDEASAKKEIMDLVNNSKSDNKKKKVTLKDLDVNSKTIIYKDTKAILKGVKLLFQYWARFKAENPQYSTLEVGKLVTYLNNHPDVHINEAFEQVHAQSVKEAV